MTFPWERKEAAASGRERGLNTNTDGRGAGKPAGGQGELGMIPWWSILLAVAAFAAMQYVFHGLMPRPKHDFGPMRLLMERIFAKADAIDLPSYASHSKGDDPLEPPRGVAAHKRT